MRKKAVLVLADGTIFAGESFGASGETMGEVVFNTSMSGYQEILTDPSYKWQLVTMTYPLIGNYGVNKEDFESRRPQTAGFIIKECSQISSNWRAEQHLEEFLKENNIVGLQGVDTRALTKHIRDTGAQVGIISTEIDDVKSLAAKAHASPGLIGRDLVREVTCQQRYECYEGNWRLGRGYRQVARDKLKWRVAAYDFGIKRNILRQLTSLGCAVTVFPAATPAEELLRFNPDGIFLSNGPGDPAALPYAIANIRKLIGKKPIFGICLGHQLLGLALGYKVFKLKFGHHGGNHPVMNLKTKCIEITAQNHGFGLVAESLVASEVTVTHINLNDGTVEGIEHNTLPCFSVQYHPEASPGPHDSSYLFEKFVKMMPTPGVEC